MVYRGRPSSGCKRCRLRKIKCDEKPMSCAKCEDKGYTCPGYESSVDRYFQDETTSVRIKAQKAKAKAVLARDERDRNDRGIAALAKFQGVIEFPILSPLIDQGIAFFMSRYAFGLEQPPIESEAYSKHLSTHGFHPIIATTMTALGLAGVANICMDSHLKKEAMRYYMDAIQQTNKALTLPSEVKSDNTLLATVLLGIFEATSNEKSLAAWSHHVNGSASLIRMRGKAQFETPAGRRMYMQCMSMLTINCLGTGSPLPDYVHELNKGIGGWEDRKDPGNRFYHLHIAAVDLRAHVMHKQITDLHDIVNCGLEIDKEAKAIFRDVAGDWNFEIEHCDVDTPGVYGTTYHIYPNLAAAQTWNWARYTRVYLHDVIRNTLIAGLAAVPPIFTDPKHLRLLEESTRVLYQMQGDIIASIPQYLHDTPGIPSGASPFRDESKMHHGGFYTPSGATILPSPVPVQKSDSSIKSFASNFHYAEDMKTTFHRYNEPSPVPRDRLPVVRVSGGYSALWALYVAGATPIATPESQKYIMRTLDRAGSEFGINQAKILSRALSLKIKIDRTNVHAPATDGRADTTRIVPQYMPLQGPHTED